MKNWTRYIKKEAGVTVEITSRHVIIYSEPAFGEDPYELLLKAHERANLVASQLEQKYGMQLGRSILCRKPHFGVYDPVLSKITTYFQLSNDIGKIDRSEGYGETDFLNPENVKEYLLMPTRLREVQHILEAQQREMVKLKVYIRQLANGQLELTKTLNKLLKGKIKLLEGECSFTDSGDVKYWT